MLGTKIPTRFRPMNNIVFYQPVSGNNLITHHNTIFVYLNGSLWSVITGPDGLNSEILSHINKIHGFCLSWICGEGTT